MAIKSGHNAESHNHNDVGSFILFKNGEPVYVRPTKNTSEGSSSGGCKKCGDTGVSLTAGGYCRTCVDIYYTDYYVDWDGEVSADRPW